MNTGRPARVYVEEPCARQGGRHVRAQPCRSELRLQLCHLRTQLLLDLRRRRRVRLEASMAAAQRVLREMQARWAARRLEEPVARLATAEPWERVLDPRGRLLGRWLAIRSRCATTRSR